MLLALGLPLSAVFVSAGLAAIVGAVVLALDQPAVEPPVWLRRIHAVMRKRGG
jgi:hypothetical protein